MKTKQHFKNTSGRRFVAVALTSLCFVVVSMPPCAQQTTVQVFINEIFPRAQTDIPEWFELFNTSVFPVSLQNWRFCSPEDDTMQLTHDSIVLQPNRFAVITKDKNAFTLKYPAVSCVIQPPLWRALDNYRDTLSVLDSRGELIDKTAYQSDWFQRWTDESLERISLNIDGQAREAWVLSAKPTPGQPNASILFRSTDKPAMEIGPIPFTPNADGKDDFLSISLLLPPTYSATVSIYGFNGKKYLDLPATAQPRYQWDGKTDNGAAAPVGPFFVVAKIKNASESIVLRKKGILWR